MKQKELQARRKRTLAGEHADRARGDGDASCYVANGVDLVLALGSDVWAAGTQARRPNAQGANARRPSCVSGKLATHMLAGENGEDGQYKSEAMQGTAPRLTLVSSIHKYDDITTARSRPAISLKPAGGSR